jgi:hypothetical protein
VGYYLMGTLGLAALLWVICLGCGLALERLLRLRLHNALLLPLGLCVAIVLGYPGYAAGIGDWLAITLLAIVVLSGFALAQGGIRARLNPGWAGAAGVAAYVLYLLPVILHGEWTWSGYDFVGDSAFEMLLANHVKGYGALLGNIPQSSEHEFLKAYIENGYPLGTQTLLGTLSGISRTSVAVLYQGYISALAALGAVALATLLQGLLSARRAAVVAFIAIAASLTYQYALQGGIKEIGLLATLCATAALAHAATQIARPYAGAALIAFGSAASLAVYNAVALPFLGALLLLTCVGVFIVHRRLPPPRAWLRWLGPLAFCALLIGLLSIPSLLTLRTFFHTATAGQGATAEGSIPVQFGQLLRKLPLSQVSGVWLAGEYRLPIASHHAALLTAFATAAIVVLLLPSVLWALWRRETGPLLILGTMGLVLLIVLPRVSPYAQGKLLAIASPAVVLAGLVMLAGLAGIPGRDGGSGGCSGGRGAGGRDGGSGAGRGARGGGRGGGRAAHAWLGPLALLLGAGLSACVLASDVLAYSYDRIAPTTRMEAIRQVGHHFAGHGLILWNEFDEYAKLLANEALISAPFEALTPGQVQLRNPTYFYGSYFDLDLETLEFVERWPIVVTRRSPAASRPPANYRLVYENEYYLGWRRESGPRVLTHMPLQQPYSPSEVISCPLLAATVKSAPSGSRLVVARAPEVRWFNPIGDPTLSAGWVPVPGQVGLVRTNTPGHAEGTVDIRGRAIDGGGGGGGGGGAGGGGGGEGGGGGVTVNGRGRYEVWVQGDFPRRMRVFVDGRPVGWVSGSDGPGQWLQAGSVWLAPGTHTLRVVKSAGHRHFGPGEFGIGTFGAVELRRAEPEQVSTLPLARWHTLCGQEADWVEVVQGGAAQGGAGGTA